LTEYEFKAEKLKECKVLNEDYCMALESLSQRK
jgi:hypothetical protein